MRRDTIFYQIFQQFPNLLFELISNPPSNAERYTFDVAALSIDRVEVLGEALLDFTEITALEDWLSK